MPISHSHYLNHIQRQQRLLSFLILHFDILSRDLRTWFWPVTQERIRVTPSDLPTYRTAHEFRAPCCLCAISTGHYTECAIYLAVKGQYIGEYVCGCAFDRCGYLVPLERMYTRRGLLIDNYPPRPAGQVAPPPVYYLPHGRAGAAGRSFARGSMGLPLIPTRSRPTRRLDTRDLLSRLDCPDGAGVSVAEFKSIFIQCECGLVTTRRVFHDHTCAAPVVIDLTSEVDADDDFDISAPIIIDLTGDS